MIVVGNISQHSTLTIVRSTENRSVLKKRLYNDSFCLKTQVLEQTEIGFKAQWFRFQTKKPIYKMTHVFCSRSFDQNRSC